MSYSWLVCLSDRPHEYTQLIDSSEKYVNLLDVVGLLVVLPILVELVDFTSNIPLFF